MPSATRRIKRASPARRVSLEILRRVELEQAYAANLLASNLTAKLSPEDRALSYELVLGVLRHQRRLDYFLEKLSGRKTTRLDPEVLLALRMGLYQIGYLTRIPARAVVDEAVNLVKMSGKSSAAGLVNAVLRKAGAITDDLIDIDDASERASIIHSHPAWLFQTWVARMGITAATALAAANNSGAPIAFRLNRLMAPGDEILAEIAAAGLTIAPSPLVADGFLLTGGDSSRLVALAERGLLHIQDDGSQLVASLVAARSGMRVLDVCAAPGGKTTAIAAQMKNRGLIVAGDIHPARVKLVKESSARLRVNIINTLCFDAAQPLPILPGTGFDRVLLDAPCTGTGTLRRNPEIKWRLRPEKIAEMAALQGRILARSAVLVAAGGRLVYSTCSLEEEENEAVVNAFLAEQGEFRLAPEQIPPALRTPAGFARTWPHRDNCDGFFAAVMIRAK